MDRWLGLLILFAANALWLLIVRFASARGMNAESTRKLFHSGSGAILLALPLLFPGDFLGVALWGATVILAMLVLFVSPALRTRFAGNVYDVDRISYGDFYFVIGVALLFFFAAPTYYTYAVPLTMLSFADALSAIIGKRFGRHKFEAVEGRKSIEGSLAFFAVAFVAVIAWSPLLPNAQPLQVGLIAVILGLVVMLLEAISWRGLDNLLIPLGGFILLRTYLMMQLPLLVINLAVVTLLVVFVMAWRRRTTLSHSALITGALFGYMVWTVAGALWDRGGLGLNGIAWLAPLLVVFLLFNLLIAPGLLEEHHDRHNVDAVFGTVFAGALWMYLAFYFSRADFIFPYSTSFACVALNLFFERRMLHAMSRKGAIPAVLSALVILATGLGMLLLLNPDEVQSKVGQLMLCAIGGVCVAIALRFAAEGMLHDERIFRWRWHVRAATALIGSLVAALPLLHWHVLTA
jgi:phytol kinase